MRQSPKEPAEQASATLVILLRYVVPCVLILPLFSILLQLIVIEQQVPLKRFIRQIKQVVVIKHDSLP